MLLVIEFWCFRRPSIYPLVFPPFGFYKVPKLNGLFNGKHDVTHLADLQTCQLHGRSTVQHGFALPENQTQRHQSLLGQHRHVVAYGTCRCKPTLKRLN
jgi:hypothetical protein